MKKDTLILVGCYNLTDEALEKESATRRKQYIAVTLDAREAIRTGYARKNWESDGHTASNGSQHVADFLLSKLEPDLNRYGVICGSAVPEFDHILSDEEATKIIEGEMARYDEVLAVSRAAYDKRANSNTVMTSLEASYDLTKEAHEELFLTRTSTTRKQFIEFSVSAREALRTGYISLHESGCPSRIGDATSTLVKLRPNFCSVGVLRASDSPPIFDHILTAEEATSLVVEEMARYDMVLAESKAKIEADRKSEKEKKDKEAEKHRSEIDDFLTDLDYYTPRIKRGEACVIDVKHADPCWFEMEGERVALRYDLVDLHPDGDWDTERAEATKRFFAEEREKRHDEPILTWIKAYGSPRLRKAVFEANLLDQVRELYHDERLAHDLLGWKFLHYATLTRDLMRAPFDHELDTFIEVAQTWPTKNARLCMIRKQHENAFTDEPIVVMECPWDKEHAPVGLLLPASAPGSAPVENLTKDPNIDSHKEFYENLPSGTILMDCAGVPVRIMEMKGLHATGVRTLGNGKPNQEILAWSGRLSKKSYRLITA
jgi:hypothetical protein